MWYVYVDKDHQTFKHHFDIKNNHILITFRNGVKRDIILFYVNMAAVSATNVWQ